MQKLLLAATAALALAGSATIADAAVELGMLTCRVDGGEGVIFGSSKTVTCDYVPAASGMPRETYTGNISRFGVDLGFTRGGSLQWAVLAPSLDSYKPGALAGYYGGVGAEITAALGVGTNVLVKKSTRDFVLQPLSIQGQTGLNIALGIAEFELVAATK